MIDHVHIQHLADVLAKTGETPLTFNIGDRQATFFTKSISVG